MLTLPHRLRYALAWDHRLCSAVLGVFIRALFRFHSHSLAVQGVFARDPSGTLRFVALPEPSDGEVDLLLAQVRRRVVRLVRRHGIDLLCRLPVTAPGWRR